MPNWGTYERTKRGTGAFTKSPVEGLGGKADLRGECVISGAERKDELVAGPQQATTRSPMTIGAA